MDEEKIIEEISVKENTERKKNKYKNILSWVATILAAFVVALLINTYVFRTSMIYGSSMYPTLENGQVVTLSKLPYFFSEPEFGDVIVLDSESVYYTCNACGTHTGLLEAGPTCHQWDKAKGTVCNDVFDEKDKYKDPGFFGNLALSLKYNVISQKLFGVDNQQERFWIKRVIGVAGDTIEFKENTFYLNGEEIEESYVNTEISPQYDNVYHNAYVNASLTVPDGYVFVMGDNRGASKDSRLMGVVPISAIIGKVTSGV
ncbi:MAG: signal peptidase I [Ruminococcaceae bacterium]|nr:signal peptidase I [Oscillospiraceae bacterium]